MTYKETKFADSAELNAAILEALAIVDAAHASMALLGGLAMQLYGSDRLTRDVDMVVERAHYDVPTATRLSFGGLRFTASNGVPVDFIMRDDDFADLYDDALSAAKTHPSGLRVVGMEHLAAIKMAAGRKKDQLDFAFLVTRDEFNHKTAKALVRRFLGPYAAKEFQSMVDIARWEKERDL